MNKRGRIYTFTIIHTASEAFKDMTPYVVAVVEDDREKFFARIEGYDRDREVNIGMEVEFSGLDDGGRPVYKFI